MTHASSQPTEAVLARHPCVGDDGTHLIVLEFRHALHQHTLAGPRTYPGARHWALETGEEVRVIDRKIFEVVATGELLLVQS